MKYIRKRIFLNEKKSKWCYVYLFDDKAKMNAYYNTVRNDKGSYKVLGAHICNGRYSLYPSGRSNHHPHTGNVLLFFDGCGAGVVSHELLHATLYAWNCKDLSKIQYPIVIKSMRQEEELLHNHSHAVMQFYRWYWRIADKVKKAMKK